MTKRFITVLIALFVVSFTQAQIKHHPFGASFQSSDKLLVKQMQMRNDALSHLKGKYNRWFNLGMAFNFEYQTYGTFWATPMFMDSTVKVKYADGYGRPWLHVAATVLDPSHTYFSNLVFPSEELYLDKKIAYTLDSVEVWCVYERNITNKTIVDTLQIQYFVFKKDFEHFEWSNPSLVNDIGEDTLRVVSMLYDHQKKSTFFSKAVDVFTTKVPLTFKDTGQATFKIFTNHIAVEPGYFVGASILFKPGYTYNVNDSLDKLNVFYVQSWKEPTTKTQASFPIHISNDWNASYIGDYYTLYDTQNTSGWYQIMSASYVMDPAYELDHHAIWFNLSADQSADVKNVTQHNLQFEMYPNPTSDELHIKLPNHNGQHLTITNTVGQIVFKKMLESSNLTQSTSLDISELESGVYFVQLSDVKSNTSVQKLIIQKR